MSSKVNWDLFDDAVEAGSGVPQLEKGIYPCKVIQVQDVEDRQHLMILFDIVKGDHKGRFSDMNKQFKSWPSQGVLYRSYKPSAYPFLKNWVTALEKSNDGYSFRSTDGDFKSFENKYFVGVFAEEEIPFPDDAGKPIVTVKLQSTRSIEAYKANEIKVPTDVKRLSDSQKIVFDKEVDKKADSSPVASEKKFTTPSDEDLPF